MVSALYKQWDEKEQKIFRDWLVSHLKMGEMTVTFYKKDGTERTMICTLEEGKVKAHEKKTDRVKEVSEEVCPVFDVEKQEWRSFRYDSIKGVNFEF
jgi:hypothetical protein